MGLNWQQDVWPVLDATYTMLRERGYEELSLAEVEQLAASLGRDSEDMELRRIFEFLAADDFIAVDWAGVILPFNVAASTKGLRHFEGWPAPGEVDLAPLIRLLEERISDPGTPEEEKRGLRKIREGLSDAGMSVATSLFTAWMERLTGLSGGQ